ncbi:MAG: site-specific integrase [Weeksellaceae bacterium]|nr:site-specific integrase [Weeksellaceae bacterium]
MKVTLRQRKKGNTISLYLDYYEKGKREYEYLGLYLVPKPKIGTLTKFQKEENKKILELAEKIRAKRLLEVQNNIYGFRDKEKLRADFMDYFEALCEKKLASLGNYGNWKSTYGHLIAYWPKGITFEKINKEWVQGFRDYLDQEAVTKTGQKLSLNTKYSYFNKLRAAFKQAIKDGIITFNPMDQVEPFPQDEPKREFLTLEELKTLSQAHCKNDSLRRMFLFSCLTGLRWSDISKLQWCEVEYSEKLGNFLRFRQAKTNGVETQPISEEARKLLGERGKEDERVFPNFKYGNWNKTLLKDWLWEAGIKKKITFHCARHTYATLQLTLGTDIYTVSKLLGHRNLQTTEIYAKVINEKKVEAANKINIGL